MRHVLLDTNVILDVALKRVPFYQDALALFSLLDTNDLTGYVTATTVTDIYYISNRQEGHDSSINFIKDLIEIVEVIGVYKDTINSALESITSDFEDAIQEVAAASHDIETIITRNKKDFKGGIEVLTPREFLTKYSAS